MKKKLLAGLVTGLVIFCLAGIANAASFSDTINFPSSGINNDYTYTHTLEGLAAPSFLQDATLSLIHSGNSDNSGEVWFTSSSNNLTIGKLSASSGATWTTDVWALSDDIIASINGSGSPWYLTVTLYDNTSGTDKLTLASSILTGNYTNPSAVPLPGSVILFGTGLLGLLGIGSRRNKA